MLVVTLVMLVMALMLGLSSFQSARLEESMAGNQRASTIAFMMAEVGASSWKDGWESYTSGFSEVAIIQAIDDIDVNLQCVDDDALQYFTNPEYNESVSSGSGYRLSICSHGNGLYSVQSVGFSGQNESVSRRVDIGLMQLGVGFLGLSPITSPGELYRPPLGEDCYGGSGNNNQTPAFCYSPPSSQAGFEGEYVDGIHNPAVSLASPGDASDVWGSLGQNQRDRYQGGIAGEMSETILTNADLFKQFLDSVRECAASEGVVGSGECEGNTLFTSDFSNRSYGGGGLGPQLTYLESGADEKITLDVSGGFSGAGLLVVDGDVEFKGTPNFDGLIVVLGSYSVTGGGASAGQGGLEGSILVSPVIDWVEDGTGCGNNYCFGGSVVDLTGGGNASYVYNADALGAAFNLLDSDAREMWDGFNESSRKSGELIFTHSWSEVLAWD
ncbi:PilX N-terminal domain-containing pilus assembly protein [Halomonas kalidii]|uniref:Type 4 fimbrial biogenesis protein PilX N-terminal domain-containing protein n=1 Tax=Halomonas kalidii TaxID=3043293 RepID=A0ABT6VHY3_9GAMM|nr:hypothetical protein [Halomonas kalidii]MDI5932613.1 hypothetical protein [Halomonas kalidii]